MPDTPTPNLGLTVPSVGGDDSVWGNEVNNNWLILDRLGKSPILSVSINTTLNLTQPRTVVLATGGVAGITITLPAASTNTGRSVVIKKVDNAVGAVSVAAASGGVDTDTIPNGGQSLEYFSDGTNWQVI